MTKPDAPKRQQLILQLLSAQGELNVADLSAQFDVSDMTVRRDLMQLESAGLLRRTHGGAALSGNGGVEPPFALRARSNAAEKARIAAVVAARVQDGQTVILDGGSTGIAIAQSLLGRRITVLALNLRVAELLSADAATRVMVPAGSIRTGEGSISGPEVESTLRQYRFDLYLMTASGFSLGQGLTEWNREDAAVKRAARVNAQGTIAACDSSKWDNVAFARICAVEDVDVVVSDDGLPLQAQHDVRMTGVELLLA